MDIPGDLVRKIADGNCVVFVGSGLSIAAGLPGWPDLLRQMIEWAEKHGRDMSDRADLEKDIENSKLLDVAEEMRERLGENDFRQFMVEVFRNPDLGPVEAHELLAEIPFSAVITSNYDTFVEDTCIRKGASPLVFTQLDYPELAGTLRDDKFYVLKVHGTINRMETIILGRSDYREVMFSNPAYQQHLATLFSTKTVLFLGFALTDPDLMTLMDKLGAIFKGYGGKHYALMHVKEVPPYRQNRFERDYNIHIIPYDDHSEVPVFLRELVQRLGKPEWEEEEEKAIPIPGGAIGVPDLPEYFLERPDYLDKVKSSVLAGAGKPVGITGAGRIGLHGMGGIGKSVLAAALARDEEILEAFPDGVIWLIISQEPNIIARQRQVAQAIGEEPPHFDDEQQGRAYLSRILADKACLIILDDVWKSQYVADFDALGKGCRMLITTRNAGILPPGAVNHCLDVMEDDEAMELLARTAGLSQDELPGVAKEVAKECGNLPLALAMIGSMARGKPDQWDAALHRLKNADLEKIKREFPDYAYPNLMRAIQVGVDALEGIRERYLDFAVFPEDTPIPEAVLETFWKPERMDIYDTRDVVNELIDRSMLRSDDRGWLSLHDLQLDYVRKQAGDLSALHNRLLDAYAEQCKDGWHTGPDDGYFFQYLPYHLKEAGRCEELRELLLNFDWLRAKLNATGVNALIGDYNLHSDDSDLRLVRGAIQLSAHVLAQYPTQLAGQLLGRMLEIKSSGIQAMLKQAAQYKASPCLLAMTSCLTPPGGPLVRTLSGHTSHVNCVAVTPDNRFAVSGSDDKTLKVWDLETGVVVRTLTGHTESVNAVTVTPDSRFAISGASALDNTLKVWNLKTGVVVRTLVGHTGSVSSVTVTPDGRFAISGSSNPDKTLKVWDLETGVEIRTLKGHTGSVSSVTVTPDNRFAISGSYDRTLKVWDLETGGEVRTLVGHTSKVNAVTVTPDSRFAVSAGSYDNTVKVWDLETGKEVRTLEGHNWSVESVTVTPDNRFAISGSWDNTLKVWDLETGGVVRTRKGHTGSVRSVTVTPDSRFAISGSDDKTLKVWDLETGVEIRTLKGHTGPVTSVTVTPDSRFAISGGYTLKVWDLETWEGVKTLKGHTGSVRSVTVTPDSRFAISGSEDRTLKVWDLEIGWAARTLKGHTGWVNAVTVTPDSRFAISGSEDNTVKVWDLKTGMEVRTLKGHTLVSSVTVAPDSRFAVSGASGYTLKVRDLETGVEIRTLQGHTLNVNAVTVTPDSRFAISGAGWPDNTLKVWNLKTGVVVRTLKGHTGWVNAVTVTPDSRFAISGSRDKTLKVWDLETGVEMKTLKGHTGWVNAVTVTPDSRFAISGSDDKTLKVWDLETGVEVKTLKGHTRWVNAITVTPDSRFAISGSSRTLKVWDLETGVVVRTLKGHTLNVDAVTVTPNSRFAISGAGWPDNTLKVWDLETGVEVRTLVGHTGYVRAVTVTPDSRFAISGSEDNTLKVWDLETGAVVRTLKGHTLVSSVTVTPDSRFAISGSRDRTLKVWDLETGAVVRTLKGHTGSVYAVTVTPDISGSSDHTLKVWYLSIGATIASFTGEGSLNAYAIAQDGKTIVAGDEWGQVHFLRLEGL